MTTKFVTDLTADLTVESKPIGTRFLIGTGVAVVGYVVGLVGAATLVQVPYLQSFAMMIVGPISAICLPYFFDRRLRYPTYPRSYMLLYPTGCVVVAAIMFTFANSRWSTWYIHPAAFQSMWFAVCLALFHFYGILRHCAASYQVNQKLESEFDSSQLSNPYAPPMKLEPEKPKSLGEQQQT